MNWILILGVLLIFAAVALDGEASPCVVRLGRFKWTMGDFVRGWLITGATRSGKTAAALVPILAELFKNVPNWGGLCIDDKGVFSEILLRLVRAFHAEDRFIPLQVRPESAPPDWKPRFQYNLLGDPRIPSSLYAKTIIDVGSSVGGGSEKGFFKTAAQIHIEKGIDVLRLAGVYVTFDNLLNFLTDENDMADVLTRILERNDLGAVELSAHFVEKFLTQPPEQLGGVRSNIFNYLHFFTNPDLVEVFCPEKNTFEFSEIDQGKIICVSMPNKYQAERRCVNTFLKLGFFSHGLRRYDKPAEARSLDNLLILIADEAQQTVTAAESGLSDYNVVDKLAEAKMALIYCTQAPVSFVPALGADKTDVLLLNLRNQIHFTTADQKSAEMIADFIGKRSVQKKTKSISGGKVGYSYAEADEHFIKPQALRGMKRFQCVICHCEKGFQKTTLRPTGFTVPTEAHNPEGKK